ncbi:hypothetical protein N7466_001000 [Penicillium verhagenii]|uniref:uncharacterized protein n=1 Tax=Penicillium verhagenii TaxID=1562060 RepID=UPI002545ABD5|nr:uncharacterized protein N7466_001000 [Penicillium verhagenii]KAJ5947985.1 hypothetical protein N7466_001000 [Penicillium verhagenii]
MGSLFEEHDVFRKFVQSCTIDDLLTQAEEGLRDGDLNSGLSDPPTLHRFLAARNLDLDGALKQFQEAILFRQKKEIVRLYDIVEVAEFEQARQFYPHWTGRRDKAGRPICMFDLACLDKTTLANWDKTRNTAGWTSSQPGENSTPKPDMLQLASVYYDGFTRMVLPLCSMMTDRPDPSKPITDSIYLVDASELGLKHAWSLRYFAQSISWLLSTCYPETIHRIFVCNAPSYFGTIWKYMKSWVDPNTAEKIVVLTSTEVSPVLAENIQDENIPTAFGGTFAFKHGTLPNLDESILRQFDWKLADGFLPPGPIKWTKDEDGQTMAVAVGIEAGSHRMKTIATLQTVNKVNGIE